MSDLPMTLVCLTECLHSIAVAMEDANVGSSVVCECGESVPIIRVFDADWHWQVTCSNHPKYLQEPGQSTVAAWACAQRHREKYQQCKNAMRVRKTSREV